MLFLISYKLWHGPIAVVPGASYAILRDDIRPLIHLGDHCLAPTLHGHNNDVSFPKALHNIAAIIL